jgi:hypothetical protein
MTQLDPGINLKNPQKQDEVPKWHSQAQAQSTKYVPVLQTAG